MGNKKLIGSLTSYPARITTVHRVIETILNQSVSLDKVILYLADEQFPDRQLPQTLTDLAKNGKFEVRWWARDIKSFKKLIPALKEFPDDNIVTFDDDILYPPNIIERLIKKHQKYPHAICGCRIRLITSKNGDIGEYKTWKRCKKWRLFLYGGKPKFRNLATTGGGTLFPPHSLHPDVFRDDIFMDLCPTTDDLWFCAMAILNGTKTAPAGSSEKITVIEESQTEALMYDNTQGKKLNDKNMNNIMDAYPAIRTRLINRNKK